MPNRRHDVNETADAREHRETSADNAVLALAEKVEQKAKGAWRRDLIIVAALYMVLLLSAVYLVQTKAIDSARATCERGNLSRVASFHLYTDLVGINQGRVQAAKESNDMPALEANRYARRQYARDRDQYIAAQEKAAIDPTVDGPDAVRVDCSRVNPYPWPL